MIRILKGRDLVDQNRTGDQSHGRQGDRPQVASDTPHNCKRSDRMTGRSTTASGQKAKFRGDQRMSALASKAASTAPQRHFRFAPINGHQPTGAAGPFRANNGLMQAQETANPRPAAVGHGIWPAGRYHRLDHGQSPAADSRAGSWPRN